MLTEITLNPSCIHMPELTCLLVAGWIPRDRANMLSEGVRRQAQRPCFGLVIPSYSGPYSYQNHASTFQSKVFRNHPRHRQSKRGSWPWTRGLQGVVNDSRGGHGLKGWPWTQGLQGVVNDSRGGHGLKGWPWTRGLQGVVNDSRGGHGLKGWPWTRGLQGVVNDARVPLEINISQQALEVMCDLGFERYCLQSILRSDTATIAATARSQGGC